MNTKVYLIALLLLLPLMAFATDSLSVAYKRVDEMEQSLKKEIEIRCNIQNELNIAKRVVLRQNQVIDSLKQMVEQNSRNIKTTADEIGVRIEETNTTLNSKVDSSDYSTRSLWIFVALFVALILSCLIYIILRKRINQGSADLDAMRVKSEKLNEDILSRMNSEMEELRKISSTMKTLAEIDKSDNDNSGEPDHSLIKTLADRITFMEMTLYKMDPKIRGYKQLTKSIAQMKDNLLANGYELVEMLGKPYSDGIKAVVSFVDDEELEPSTKVITAIIKPQINYNGVMIQAAQITVSQN